MRTIVLAAASTEADQGWGKLLALLLAGGLFWAFTEAHKRWRSLSPTSPADADHGVSSQVSGPADPTADPAEKGAGGGADKVTAFVADRAGKARTTDIIAAARAKLGVSASTVKRRLRQIRDARR